MMKRIVAVCLLIIQYVLGNCSSITDCVTCTNSPSWSGNCRWCEIDGKCHEKGSISNECNIFENIRDPLYCGCNGNPTPGFGPDICTWYTNSTPSYELSNNTSLWYGGDFLPPTYTAAAQCACQGDGNPLWNAKAASCVRTFLIHAHQKLSNETKSELREATISNNPIEWSKWAGDFEQIHINAYATCYCPGKPAPYADWLGIVWGGNFLPCPAIIDAILQFGRCGCGW